MRRFFIILAGILFLFSSSAFIFTKQQTSNFPNPSTHKIMEIASLWDLLASNYEPNWDRDQTWLDVGIRSKYAKAKNYASLKMIEEAFALPLFVRGPHTGDIDFENRTSFGYYNPAFIQELEVSFETALQNPVYKMVLKRVYKQYFSSMAETYHAAYMFIHEDPGYIEEYLKPRYLEGMASPGGGRRVLSGRVQGFCRSFTEKITC